MKRSHDSITRSINSDDNSETNMNNDSNNNKPNQRKKINLNKKPSIFFIFDDLTDYESDNKETISVPPICHGIHCDHDPNSCIVPIIPDKFNHMTRLNLDNLIELGELFHCKLQKNFRNIPLERLAILRESLLKLNKTIGMNSIKESICEQLIYFLMDLEPNPQEMLHTVIQGPPGVGKSFVIDILAEIYLKMGYLSNGKINKVKLDELKGKYIGHSAPLTQKAIDNSIGGVLVLDEVYAIGNSDHLDSFSKEVIDTINRNLTEKAGKFVCIIAGYGEQIDKCFFAHNEGLRSRFRFRFSIDSYSPEELFEIFKLKVENDKWKLSESEINLMTDFFRFNRDKFPYFGRDIETLLFHTKVAHSNRIIYNDNNGLNKTINLSDIQQGFAKFSLNSKESSTDDFNLMYL